MAPIARVLYFPLSRVRLLDVFLRALILLALVAIAAGAGGRLLFSEAAESTTLCDFSRLLAVSDPPKCREVSEFPLVRDYASIFHIVMIAVMGTYGDVLIRGLSSFFRTAEARGVLVSPTNAQKKAIESIDLPSTRVIGDIIVLVFGLGMVYFGAVGYGGNGIYPLFSFGENREDFALAASAASWSAFPLPGYFAFLLVGAIGNYYILQILWVSGLALWIGIRSFLGGRLRLLAMTPDSRWGWTAVFDATHAGVVTSVFGLLGLLALLLRGGYENFPHLVVFPFVALAAVMPWFIINRIWRRAVDHSLEAMGKEIDASVPAREYLLRLNYLAVQQAPERIVPLATSALQLVFTVIPGALAIAQLTGYWQ